ncbi:hypothetical protein NEPAR06_0472 [Nematocida parisii]|uniref:Uncharacterized protein n=1 Tax=Nematocida parisii (strain ERTm3) TaxID=935791 RepID=I3EJI5_NEMP3|nr:uncharacterized protein NEPG_01088 [Nematocida parisii ERTm1]EIJ89382.1 hypothetical protein NEQG_00152 [Nematocida parisii ERTm3]KAI5142609.1 hypothetical protein NEPAR07_0214 [Nematocida parisii]EIJ94420.1 hypothetical protein NEPG_01088 [Nematocida parisii ERTm1]KAI5153472.1 hypothetical protein NEPAR06_0472 [Nematocida parisii]KAI5158935.1 hypothetical protein NEPAR05_2282 [Nematocida parisii]|eukprot:XP_013058916.1 hypothetical protein NEPG_01088 [Nematocida parisii ERTm1]
MKLDILFEIGLAIASIIPMLTQSATLDSAINRCEDYQEEILDVLKDIEAEIEDNSILTTPVLETDLKMLYITHNDYIKKNNQLVLYKIKLHNSNQNLYECDKTTSSRYDIFSPDLRNYAKNTTLGRTPAEKLCMVMYYNMPGFIHKTRMVVKKLYDQEQTTADKKRNNFIFTWKDPTNSLNNYVGLATIAASKKSGRTSVEKMVMSIYPNSICTLHNNSTEAINASSEGHRELIYPFKTNSGNKINIRRFKDILNKKSSGNVGFEFLKTTVGFCTNYIQLYNNPILDTHGSMSFIDKAHADLDIKNTELSKRINKMILDLSLDIPIKFTEYIELIEDSFNIQMDAIHNLICDSSYYALRNMISKYYINIIDRNKSIKPMTAAEFYQIRKSLLALVNSYHKEEIANGNILSNVIDLNLSSFGKDIHLFSQPSTLNPSEKYTQHLLKLAWARFGEFESNLAGRERQYEIIVDDLKTLNHTVSMHKIVRSIESVASYCALGEFGRLRELITQLYIITSEIDLIHEEITNLKEYKLCLSGNSDNPAILNNQAANTLLNKINLRNTIIMSFMTAISMQKYKYSEFDLLSKDSVYLDVYDLFNINQTSPVHDPQAHLINIRIHNDIQRQLPKPSPITTANAGFTPLSCAELGRTMDLNRISLSNDNYKEYLNLALTGLSTDANNGDTNNPLMPVD